MEPNRPADEQALTAQLMGLLGPGMLLVAEGRFLSHKTLKDAVATGAHTLFRAGSDTDLPVLSVLADGTYISRIAEPEISDQLPRQDMPGADIPGITVRVIESSAPTEDGNDTLEVLSLVTDLIDPAQLSAIDAADAYGKRWEIETAFGELVTGIRSRSGVVLRPKSPDMIRQELYAALCVYQAIRTLICTSNQGADLDPRPTSGTSPTRADPGHLLTPPQTY